MFVMAMETETGKAIVVNEFKTADVQIPEFSKEATPPADGETPETDAETEDTTEDEAEDENQTEDEAQDEAEAEDEA